MTREYDLDEQVRRAIERERRPRPKPSDSGHKQLPLFDTISLAAPASPRITSTAALLPDDEMLFSRVVSLHSAQKAFLARTYATIVGTAMGGKMPLWWIELFAGPGRLVVRETGDFIPGSPLEALTIPRPFDGYVFADLTLPCVQSLRRRVAGYPQAHVLHGDANHGDLHDQIRALVPRDALVVLYGDQEGLDLQWPTVKFFIDRYRCLDLLLNLPTEGTVRAVVAGQKLADDRYAVKARAMLDHPHPEQLLEGSGPKGALVREYYRRRLEQEGFDQIEGVTIKLVGRNRDLYDLMIASRNRLAPKFFHAAIQAFERHRAQAIA